MSYNPYSLEGKNILITGASSGIGRATAIECSKLGATVFLLARNSEKLDIVMSELANIENGHKKVVLDLSHFEELPLIIEKLPVLDGFVSNAGTGNNLPIQFYSEKDIKNVFDVNLIAPMLFIKHLIRTKKLKKQSSVVFTSSAGGVYQPGKCNGIYESSKSAIHAYMRVSALEMGKKGIRFNSVNPSMVDTEFIHGGTLSEEQLLEDKKKYALGRYGTPQDIAFAIIYLLSDASSWVTGTDIKIDGGRTLFQ